MIRFLGIVFFSAFFAFGLVACTEEDKTEKNSPSSVKQVEKTTSPPVKKKDNHDMTPSEAVDNMKRDAGLVGDKAVEGYNALKNVITKTLSD